MNIKNPVIPGYFPDPSICRKDDTFYLATSSFEYFPGVPILSSKDLVNWTLLGHALIRKSQLDLQGRPSSAGIFAPTLRYHNGIFYMITTDVAGRGHFYVTTTDPAGEWSEPIWVTGPGFDPDLFFDDDGKVYFTREDITGYGLRLWEIDCTSGTLLGEETLIWEGFEDRLCEAPHIYKRGGWYYLLAAEGGTYRGHMIVVGRSRSVRGPYESCPRNPILTHRHRVLHPVQSLGHGDFIEAPDGSWWLVCLGTRPVGKWHHLGRETFLAPVTWDQDHWPVINHDQEISLDGMEAPPFCTYQNLNVDCTWQIGNPLPLDLEFRRYPFPALYSYQNENQPIILNPPGLDPMETLPDTFSFTGIRQRDFSVRFTAQVSIDPLDPMTFGGITVMMNETHRYCLGIAQTNGKPHIRLHKQIGSTEQNINLDFDSDQRGTQSIYDLMIQADKNWYSFFWKGPNQDTYQLVGKGETRYLSSEVAGGFTGVYLGFFNEAGGSSPLAVNWFRYEQEY